LHAPIRRRRGWHRDFDGRFGRFSQTVYPIDRADILVGARFDFKVEFVGLADPTKVSVTLNGKDHAELFGKAATFVEREDGKDQSALWSAP